MSSEHMRYTTTRKSGGDPFDEFAKDDSFPCPKCEDTQNPRMCSKACFKYKLWVSLDWINMQYNAGIISKMERNVRMDNAKQKYLQGDN